MEEIVYPGHIEVVCGPMFAGKSEELIRRIKRLSFAKKKVLVFKPKVDVRYEEEYIVSHSRQKSPAIRIEKANEILDYLISDIYAICIDEVQFLDDGIIDICNVLASLGKRVIVGGLDMDFAGRPFPIVAKLLGCAESVTKLSAVCVVCGAPATFTQRLVNGKPAAPNDPVILIGASESYEPRCRHCHEITEK